MAAKELIVVAGPNGAGKTTFAEEFLARRPCLYVSADRIASDFAPEDPMSERGRAGREFFRQVYQHLAASESFLVESTLSGRAFARVLEKAQESGFEIRIIFVYLQSVEACIARVTERVRKGGHAVPDVDVRRRFVRSLANFWQIYRRFADHWTLVYNGGGEFIIVAIGTGGVVSVRDETLFHQFLHSAGVDRNG